MWLLRERLTDFREKIIWQSKSRTNQFYIQLIVLHVHPKTAIIFDHSRLGLENKFFPNTITQSPTYTTFILIGAEVRLKSKF